MSDSEYEQEVDPDFAAFFPSAFGKQDRQANVAKQLEQARRAPAAKAQKDDASGGESDEDDEYGSESDDEDQFPVSHELVIKVHEKGVTSISLDNSGSRMITGSKDCQLKLFDFTSMSPTTVRAFKSVDPAATKQSGENDAYPIHQVSFNPNAPNQILVVTALPQARIADRDGDIKATFVKGDMYLRDLHNTKGHTAEITSGAWHPLYKDVCVTASTDSSLRIWNVHETFKQKEIMVQKSKQAGNAGKTRLTAVAWGKSQEEKGTIIVTAALDGTLSLYGGEGPYHRPLKEIREAHKPDTWTSGIDISADGRLIVTRGGDNTIKLWDPSKFKTCLREISHPSTSEQYPTSSIRFSPNGMYILVGSPTGNLHILNAGLREELVTPVTPGSPLICALWHDKINQIITGSANAEIHVLFNPDKSTGGAKAVLTRAPKVRHFDDDPNLTVDLSGGVDPDSIMAGGTGPRPRKPATGLTHSGRPLDPRRPHIPQTTPFAQSTPTDEHIKMSIVNSDMRMQDPREALLKYANVAEKDRMFTGAWAETQPKTIFASLSDDEEEPDTKKQKR